VLVYEYLPNKSLDKILFHPNNRNQLDWQKRYNIILGVARGLLYLHQDSLLRIIHRDIKASNVLLDEKLNPKIADFGLAKHFPDDESHVSTRLAGTFGYMAPEYAMQGQLSVKADVYSFGVLLLEIITGRKNTDYSLPPEMRILLGWAWKSYERGNIVRMIDPTIIETCDEEQASRCIHVGLLCTQAEASLRPLMSAAVQMLSSDSATLPNPTKPVFVSSITQITNPTGSGSSHASASTTSASSTTPLAPPSGAYTSITQLVPR
jgi:serine/threonine protein kinase